METIKRHCEDLVSPLHTTYCGLVEPAEPIVPFDRWYEDYCAGAQDICEECLSEVFKERKERSE